MGVKMVMAVSGQKRQVEEHEGFEEITIFSGYH
jgi:hypothetical protein